MSAPERRGAAEVSGASGDPVEALMGRAEAHELEVARRLRTAFQLVALETADSRSGSAAVDPQRAVAALREHDLNEGVRVLEDLLVHAASPCRSPGTFATLPAARGTYTEATRALLELAGRRAEGAGVDLPAPGSSPLDGMEHLLEWLESWTARPGVAPDLERRARIWRARFERYRGDAGAAEALLEETLRSVDGRRGRRVRDERMELLAELTSIQLDRGDLDGAARTVQRGGPVPRLPSDVTNNLHALALALEWLRGDGPLPALEGAFRRFGHDVPPAWARLVSRIEPPRGAERPPIVRPTAEGGARPRLPGRQELGAQALVSLVLDDGRLREAWSDVAPGLEGSLEDWLRGRRHVVAGAGARRAESSALAVALLEARPVVLVLGAEEGGRDEGLGRACIDPDGAPPRAAIALPVLRGAEVVAVLWMEFAHRLLPSAERLADLARGAAAHPTLRNRGGAAVRVHEVAGEALGAEEQRARAGLRRLWEELVEELGLKTTERRWAVLQRLGEHGDLELVAQGGQGERLGDPERCGLWAVRRVLAAGGFVRYEPGSNDEAAMLHPGARAGVAIAVPGANGADAVVVVESARRGDGRERDARRWAERLAHHARRVRVAALDLRDRRRGGAGLVLDALAADEGARLDRVEALARTGADLMVRGEAGSGRRTLARAVHHARRPRPGRSGLVQVSGFGLTATGVEEALGAAEVETVVLTDIGCLDAGAQASLVRALERPTQERPRVIATALEAAGDERTDRREPVLSARQHPDLLRNLERLDLRATPLRRVRHRIPSLARAMARRWEASVSPGDPVGWRDVPDEVDALLWRQPWEGNAAALEDVVRRVCLRIDGAAVDLRAVVHALAGAELEVVPRLPSREPAPLDVASALWVTRTSSGRFNKTRAAAYCGWDPDTLSARARDLGLADLDAVARVLMGERP